MNSLLIRNVILEGAPAWVHIQDGIIRTVSRHAPEAGSPLDTADRVLDAAGLHLFPSLKNGHTHAAMTLFRGWGDDLPLREWLTTRIWPAEGRMTEGHVYHGTRLALLEMIRSGTTFLNDMYWHSAAVGRAVDEMGMRACLGSVFIDLGDEARGRRWRERVERELEARQDLPALVTRSIAPHAIYTVSPQNLEWLGERAREHDLPVHIHLSETREEVEGCVERYGVRPAFFLERVGLVGPGLVAAHGCWLDPDELALLGAAGATVVHNPTANLKLATGRIFDYAEARSAGVRVILGTDGAGSNNNLDLVEEMKIAALVQKHRAEDPTVLPADEALALATTEASRTFGLGKGTVAPGEPADLILVDFSAPATQPLHDPVSDLVYAAHGGVVHTTVCAGRVLMWDRRVEMADEEEILLEAGRAARELVGGQA